MQLRLLGVMLGMPEGGLSLADLFAHLHTLRGQAFPGDPHPRMIYVEHRKPHHLGLLLTVKDQRRFYTLRQRGAAFTVDAREVEKGASLIDFNFFAIHEETGRGLYQHYHNSCGVGGFGDFLRARHREVVKAPRKQLTVEQMVRKEHLAKLLEELARIRSFDFDVVAIDQDEAAFRPLSKFVVKRRVSLSLTAGPIHQVRAGILNYVDKRKPERGRIVGDDADGNRRVLHLLENPDSFGEYDYEDVAPTGSFSPEHFARAGLVTTMLDAMAAQRAIFEAPLK